MESNKHGSSHQVILGELVGREVAPIVTALINLLRSRRPTNSQISGLEQALAWHRDRQDSPARLEEFRYDLDRLMAQGEKRSQDVDLVVYLNNLIGAGRYDQIWRKRVLRDLGRKPYTWPASKVAQAEPQIDLLMAQEVMGVLQVLMRSTELQAEIGTSGGFLWEDSSSLPVSSNS